MCLWENKIQIIKLAANLYFLRLGDRYLGFITLFSFAYVLIFFIVLTEVLFKCFVHFSLVRFICNTFHNSFPLWFITGYQIYFPVLYRRTLLFIHSIYNSLHLLIQTPDPSFPHPLSNHKSVLCLWVCFCFV